MDSVEELDCSLGTGYFRTSAAGSVWSDKHFLLRDEGSHWVNLVEGEIGKILTDSIKSKMQNLIE